MRSQDARKLLDDLFEEVALAIGGIVALHHVDDEVIERLCDSLISIRRKAVARVTEAPGGLHLADRKALGEPHPAIEEFLAQLDHR